MRKLILTLTAAATIVASSVAVPTKANAGCHGCWVGGAVAAGLIGGAILSNRAYGYRYYDGYAPSYGYYYYPRYRYSYAPAYYGYYPRYRYRYYGYPVYNSGYYGRRYGYRRLYW